MIEKRFTDNGIEEIENQSFTDNLTGKTYWIDHGLDEIIDLLNDFNNESKQFKQTNEKVIDKILDGVVEMHDGKRDYAEKLFNEAIELIE